jgi:WD40 repeat protein/serine/threonine protein kinase
MEKDDLSGRKVGEFVLRERIGEGGFGAVYSCEQPLLGREAVVKVLHGKLRRRDVIAQRFMREAQLASRLDHPYAAHVYAFGIEEHDKLLWIAMERVRGITLAEWLNTHGPMPLGQFVSFFERIAAVVQTGHERGIVHRDLKPSNVMVIERAGELLPKLLDFGVAKILDGVVPPEGTPELNYNYPPLPASDDLSGKSPVSGVRAPDPSTATEAPPRGDARLTQNNQTVGSPPYMSPEQWVNPGTVGAASDLYALAVVAYEALTGRRPFQAATLNEYIELHCRGKVPALGGNFPSALDRMLQRALAKRPEDRWPTALELAGALRSASGIGADRADLPRIDEGVRDAWLGKAPQSLAESVAALEGARNAHQARDAAQELVRSLLRYLPAMALATWPGDVQDAPALLELVRALGKRELAAEERLQLLRLLVRSRGGHPIPELLALMTTGAGNTDLLEPILSLYSINDHSGSEEAVRLRLGRLIPELTRLLRETTFVCDYVLVVPRGDAAERWTGRRQEHRAVAAVAAGELVDGHPMLLDRDGRICADLWPLVQAAAPSDGAEPEMFVFDGRGRHGAQLIAAPRSIVRDDSRTWTWVATRLIAEVEAKARMRDQVRTAAHQWQDRARSDGLLWRGDVLADVERWTRHTAAASLGDLEASFIAASRRAARRARWIRRALVAAAVMTVLGVVAYRAELKARAAEQIAQQSEVEQGRQALLHDDTDEAQLHLSAAYRMGDQSPSVSFMLARALQPRMAVQARFTAAKGRMWSASFSPDGRQIVTTDDTCAQIWDALTSRLLFKLPHDSEVNHAVYSKDGARLVTGAADTVRIWDASTGALVRELKRNTSKPPIYFIVALSPDGQLVAAIDAGGEVAHVWDAVTGAALAELRNDASGFPSIAFSADGHWLATSGGDDVRVFDTSTWSPALTLAGPGIRSLGFDPTGPRIVTGSTTGDSTIWAIPQGTRIRHLREIGEPVDELAFSPNGELIVTASRDGAEQVWNATSGALQSQGNYVRSRIFSVEFDPTSRLVVAAGDSGKVVVADAVLGMAVAVLEAPQSVIRVAHFDPTSRRVVGASRNGSAWVWDATSPFRRWSSPPISDDCGLVMSLEPDARFVVVGCRDRTTRVWDTSRDELIAELPSVTQVDGDFASAYPAVSASGDRAAIARGHMVMVYALPGGRLLRTIMHRAPVTAVAFARNGHDLVSGAVDGAVLVTHDEGEPIVIGTSPSGIDVVGLLANGRVVAVDAARQMRFYEAAPDGNHLLAEVEVPTRVGLLRVSQNGLRMITVPSYTGNTAAAVLWDLEHYRVIAKLEGNVGQVLSARFAASDRTIITAGNDGAVRLWDGATGKPAQIYRARARFFGDATLVPDGSMIVAGDSEGRLEFWDTVTGRLLWTLRAHKSHVVGVHFEGGDIVTRGFGGDVSRWTLPRPELVIEACSARAACAIVSK